jgi:AraC-like DNA-binding protein
VRRASSIEDFLAAPIGAYVVDRAFAYFAPHDHLSGYMVWGRPTAFDFEALARILPIMHAPTKAPHAVMLDLRAMEGLEQGAFHLAVTYTLDNYAAFKRAVARLAIVRGNTVGGAIAAGFFRVVPAYSPLRVFTRIDKTLDWLGRSGDLAWYDALYRELEETRGIPSLLQGLREILDADPRVSIVESAKRLGVSPRTLQRRLAEARTNLTREAAGAQIRMAQRLLLETEATLTEIAYAVGCSSAQHFSTLFRRMTGEAPSEWRARRTSGAGTSK